MSPVSLEPSRWNYCPAVAAQHVNLTWNRAALRAVENRKRLEKTINLHWEWPCAHVPIQVGFSPAAAREIISRFMMLHNCAVRSVFWGGRSRFFSPPTPSQPAQSLLPLQSPGGLIGPAHPHPPPTLLTSTGTPSSGCKNFRRNLHGAAEGRWGRGIKNKVGCLVLQRSWPRRPLWWESPQAKGFLPPVKKKKKKSFMQVWLNSSAPGFWAEPDFFFFPTVSGFKRD